MSTPQIRIRRLCKQYGDRLVLENVSLDVQAGERVSIVGASGCGKTTFFRLLLGEEQATAGELLLDGRPWPQEPGADRGVVFQRYSVFPHLTVLANVRLALELPRAPLAGRLFGAARRQADAQAMAMLQAVGLAGSAGQYPHQLSGGMQQRLALAQSLVARPRILLLDEPFAALDPGITADMHALLLSLWEEQRFTLFLVTHDIQEGFRLGTRLLVFDRVRVDPQAPERYGARIAYDIPLTRNQKPAELAGNLKMNAPLAAQGAGHE